MPYPYERSDFDNHNLWQLYEAIVENGGGSTPAANSDTVAFPWVEDTEIEFLPALSTRLGFIVFNNTDLPLYLKLGDGCNTSDNFSLIVQPGGSYERTGYTGLVTGAQGADGTGNILVTELLP